MQEKTIKIKNTTFTLNLQIIDGKVDNASVTSNEKIIGDKQIDSEYNGAIDGLESFILALACEGVDMEDVKISNALVTALDAIGNNL